MKNSQHKILAIDEEKEVVAGFINAISDQVLSAYIPLLEVKLEYQGQEIGSRLVEKMLEETKNYYMVDLLCDSELQPFYEKRGLQKANGMFLRHYQNQTGKR